MRAYLLRRLLLIIPTLIGIMALNFFIIQVAPGGPVEQLLARLQGTAQSSTARITGGGAEVIVEQRRIGSGSDHRAAIAARAASIPPSSSGSRSTTASTSPIGERFLMMLRNYATFDFGKSFFRDTPVVELIIEKMPVSISIGVWTTLIVYLVSIPLGIAKAVRDGSRFDSWTSAAVITGSAIPAFLFAILLIVLFAGGRYVQWFPLARPHLRQLERSFLADAHSRLPLAYGLAARSP